MNRNGLIYLCALVLLFNALVLDTLHGQEIWGDNACMKPREHVTSLLLDEYFISLGSFHYLTGNYIQTSK